MTFISYDYIFECGNKGHIVSVFYGFWYIRLMICWNAEITVLMIWYIIIWIYYSNSVAYLSYLSNILISWQLIKTWEYVEL